MFRVYGMLCDYSIRECSKFERDDIVILCIHMILTNQTFVLHLSILIYSLLLILLMGVPLVTNCILNCIRARDNVAFVIHFTITVI